jgi:hypothetical protein
LKENVVVENMAYYCILIKSEDISQHSCSEWINSEFW